MYGNPDTVSVFPRFASDEHTRLMALLHRIVEDIGQTKPQCSRARIHRSLNLAFLLHCLPGIGRVGAYAIQQGIQIQHFKWLAGRADTRLFILVPLCIGAEAIRHKPVKGQHAVDTGTAQDAYLSKA